MPKHGWKWRTEQVRNMDNYELHDFLGSRQCSARLARWVYRQGEEFGWQVQALERISDCDATWARKFLWAELEKHKTTEFGDWVVIALGSAACTKPEDAEKYLALYDDDTAHVMTRGSAIYGLTHAYQAAKWEEEETGVNPLSPELIERIRGACHRAIHDQTNPYGRAGACWLGPRLGGFEKELEPLQHDHTLIRPTGTSLTVASHYEPPEP